MAGYMHKPEEVLTMFSDALKILDHNTVQYMIEEQAQLLEEQLQKIDEQNQQLDEQNQQLTDQKQQLDDQQQQIDVQKQQLDDQKQQLNDQKQQLAFKDHQLAEEKYKTYISACQDMGLEKEDVIQKIMGKFNLSQESADEKIQNYW